jgi:predicted HTH transcriptional regulator
MIWEGKRLRDVTETDLRQILESGVEEQKHLDYKAELYAKNDAGQKDFLIDVCAFANAEGGILLIGTPLTANCCRCVGRLRRAGG